MILPIKKYPDPVLRKKCQEVEEVTPEIKKLGLNMIETMVTNQGIGLAAPQVNVLKRIIVVHPISERTPGEMLAKKPQVFINLKITKKSRETMVDEEGCLSFPGLFLKIKRAKEVEIETLDGNGKKTFLKLEGLPARVFQHEIDHLDGILFIDRLSFWQRLKLRGKLKEYGSR